jgi:hypothetical protein
MTLHSQASNTRARIISSNWIYPRRRLERPPTTCPVFFSINPVFPQSRRTRTAASSDPAHGTAQQSLLLSKDVAGLLREMALVDVALAQRERGHSSLM